MERNHYSYSLKPEDQKLVEKIQAHLSKTIGPVSAIAAIRAALRKYVEVAK